MEDVFEIPRQRYSDRRAVTSASIRVVSRRQPLTSWMRLVMRKVGYNSVQAATNGIEFHKSKEFCKEAAEAD